MVSKRKFFLLLAVVAIVAAGAVAVSAQATTPPAQPPFAGMGRGMGLGTHLMWDGDSAPMFTAFAQALGIDEQTLISELQSGKTLAQLAQEKGIDLTTVTQTARTTMKQHLDALVTSGALTQAQADARLSLMQQHWAEMPLLNCAGCGSMMGTGRGGMMGMGRGGMWDNDATPRGRMGRGG